MLNAAPNASLRSATDARPSQHLKIHVRIKPVSGAALLVEVDNGNCVKTNETVFALDYALRVTAPPGITSLTPAYRSLLLRYDPRQTTFIRLRKTLHEKIGRLDLSNGKPKTRRWRLPAVYGGTFGIDLPALSARLSLVPDELIERHQHSTFVVAMLGFQPGFAYMHGLDPTLNVPRRASPRFSAPPGTLKIGNGQAAIQSMEGPSGWHWIGRTPVPLFDSKRTPAILLSPGDRVSFDPISERDFETLKTDLATGKLSTETMCDEPLH